MDPSADARLSEWAKLVIAELHAADRRATDIAGSLSREQLNWKAAPERWSVGQCLEHLAVTNDVYLPPIAKALEHQSPAPVEVITPGWVGRWFIRIYIEPSPRTRRARAPKKSTPASHVDAKVLDRFLASNEVTRRLVRRASAFDVNRIRFKNPFVAGVRFTVGTGFEIVWRHESRHLLQTEQVLNTAGFPS